MLVACRLAGLSALEGTMQASTRARNVGRRSAPAISPCGEGGRRLFLRRAATAVMWAVAASFVPLATTSGFWRRMRRISAASRRRMRWAFSRFVTRLSRRRTALAGVGASTHRSRYQFGGEIVTQFERLRIIAPELLADAVGKPVALLAQVLGHARPLAQLDHDRVFDCKPAKAMPVGSQRVAEHVGVPAVVFGAGDGEAIAEAVELFRVDRIDLEAALEQDLDNRTMRRLDRDSDLGRLFAARRHQPVAHLRQACSAVREGSLADNFAISRTDR